MALAALQNDHHGPGLLPSGRSRNLRTIVLAGVLLIFVWALRQTPLFRAHKSKYKSQFEIVNPSRPPPPAPPPTTVPVGGDGGGKQQPTQQQQQQQQQHPNQPIALTGDNFYLTDALNSALHPPAPPPPPEREFPGSVAVIMETDPSRVRNLVPVMLHFANVLGPSWPVVLVTLRQNWVEPPSPPFRRLMAERRIKIFFLPDDDVVAFPDHASVSKFLARPWLWERFQSADRVLLFQADSVLCSRSAARVDDFLEWDLVGAPIAERYGVGFNGGLSLRNPKALLDITRDPEVNTFARRLDEIHARLDAIEAAEGREAAEAEGRRIPSWEKFEDQWFYVKLRDHLGDRARLPPVDVASRFAVETIWNDEPLGYHQPFRWLSAGQRSKALDWCPEVAMLQEGSHFFA